MAVNQYTFKRHGVGLPDVTMPIDRALYSVNGGPMASTAGKIVCVGRNYADHAKELGNEVPESPLLFMKPSSAIQPLHGERLRIPTGQGACHHELELAVLIGGLMQGVSADNALTNVAGYALGLDLTLRDNLSAKLITGNGQEYTWKTRVVGR